MSTGATKDKKLLSLVLRAGCIGLWCWDTDEGRVTVSDSWFCLTGHDPECVREVLARLPESALSEKEQLKHLIEWWAENVHPEDLAAAKLSVERYLLLEVSAEEGYKNSYRFWNPRNESWTKLDARGQALWEDGRIKSLVVIEQEVNRQLVEAEQQLTARIAKLEAENRETFQQQSATLKQLARSLRRGAVTMGTAIALSVTVMGALSDIGQEFVQAFTETKELIKGMDDAG